MSDSVRPHRWQPTRLPHPGILQARILEWVAISFSNAWKWKVKVKSLSRVRLLATPWMAAHQAPSSMGFPRQEYWSGVPLPSPHIPLLTCNYLFILSMATLKMTAWVMTYYPMQILTFKTSMRMLKHIEVFTPVLIMPYTLIRHFKLKKQYSYFCNFDINSHLSFPVLFLNS